MRRTLPTPGDQPTRDRIVSDFGRNFLVEAGAGSGMTIIWFELLAEM